MHFIWEKYLELIRGVLPDETRNREIRAEIDVLTQ